jgi:hypothetical protein
MWMFLPACSPRRCSCRCRRSNPALRTCLVAHGQAYTDSKGYCKTFKREQGTSIQDIECVASTNRGVGWLALCGMDCGSQMKSNGCCCCFGPRVVPATGGVLVCLFVTAARDRSESPRSCSVCLAVCLSVCRPRAGVTRSAALRVGSSSASATAPTKRLRTRWRWGLGKPTI